MSLVQELGDREESAWVLQDAGFAVLVPSWWTPQGRRRAKVRLRAAPPRQASPDRPAAGAAKVARAGEPGTGARAASAAGSPV